MNHFFFHNEIFEEIKNFEIIKCYVSRCYFGSEYRNQWVNWDGETSVVGRYSVKYSLTIDDMKNICENNRKNGSSFIIRELPLFVFESSSKRICVSWHDYYFTQPDDKFVKFFNAKLSVYDLLVVLRKEFDFCAYYGDIKSFPILSTTNIELPFMIRTSSPGKNGSAMVWSCKPLVIDTVALRSWLESYSEIGCSVS